ncbi:hypothetical protein B4133_2348 [Bacillus altitudinis]|nr:hypothetical protein B4133_2348 [Bacillus altitudinis]
MAEDCDIVFLTLRNGKRQLVQLSFFSRGGERGNDIVFTRHLQTK